MQPLHELNPGETYANAKYKVWKRDESSITVIRKIDNHIIVFHKGSINYDWIVKKD
jgi:hypothetical protein